MTEGMYVVATEGRKEQILDLAGVYRVVALANPLDGYPMALDARTVVAQMTLAKSDSVLPDSTRDALHALVWGAVSGEVTTYRFSDGPVIALTVRPGTEYEPPKKEYGEVKAPKGSGGAYRERRYGRR
jgi:hypothetical protein